MSVEILKQRMAAQIDAMCREKEELARQEMRGILAEAEQMAEQRRAAALAQARREQSTRIAAAVHRARSQAEQTIASFQESIYQDVLARMEQEIVAVARDSAFSTVVQRLLAEATAAYPAYTAVFTASTFVMACRAWLTQHGKSEIPVLIDEDLWDGVAVGDPERTVLVRNTLRGRLRRFEPELRRRCRAELFGT